MEVESNSGRTGNQSEESPTTAPIKAEIATVTATINDEEEDISDLLALFQSTEDDDDANGTDDNDYGATNKPKMEASAKVDVLSSILTEPQSRYGSKATSLKERCIYSLARTHCKLSTRDSGEDKDNNNESAVASLLTGPTCQPFLQNVTKAKCAKVVRAVLDIICDHTPSLTLQSGICRSILSWCETQKRTFLRQRVESRLASILFQMGDYKPALDLVDSLLTELKRLDDKQLLVEAHLVECKIHHGLRGMAKAKAALTASRTCANAIYVAPVVQAGIDEMSGVLHCEEGDYNTAHSYFLEAFEQLDQMEDNERALLCLNYMMLCKILDAVVKALRVSSKGGVGAKSNKAESDISNMITPRQAVKYAGRSIEAMTAIASAASSRSLSQYSTVLKTYSSELHDDLLIRHHLTFLREQLLESNLIRIVEPYSVVQIDHVAKKIGIMEGGEVEKKLSQMILDGKLRGILDQGRGRLIVYEEGEKDMAMEGGLEVIENMDRVVSSLFKRSRALGSVLN